MMTKKQVVAWVASIAVAAWAAQGQAGAQGPAPSVGSTREAKRPQVKTVQPVPAAKNLDYTIPGRTESYETTLIFTRATGIVRERRVDIGDRVKEGDILAIVDVPDIDRDAERAQAAVDQAKARADNARLLSQRAEGLAGSRAIAEEEIEQRRANLVEAEAAVRVAAAELGRLQEQQRFATVRAPFAGVIAERNVNRGDRVRGDESTAEGWLYRLVRLDRLRFVVGAPPDLALQLKPGATGRVFFREMPGRTITATVERASGVFNEQTGTMRVELTMENPEPMIPAGLTGGVVFGLVPGDDAFLVPTNTIITTRGQASLASVADGRVRMVQVSLGRNLGTSVEARSTGLSADLPIIVNPNALLREGDEVEVVPNTPKS